jgi:O-antigen ligase
MGAVAWSGAAMLALLFAFSLLGVSIRGRVGEINADFLRQYALSVLSLDDANARLGRDDDRVDWLRQAWQSTASDPVTLLTGQGFGKPLIDFETEDGVPVRQPHNAAMAVFGRLGIIGVSVWLLSQVLFFKRFLTALKTQQSPEVHDLVLWLLIFYVLAFVISMVQPSLEFSHYSIPLYFILGFSLKVLDTVLAKSRAKQAFRTVVESRA